MTKIAVFSGGRGTRYVQEALSGVDCRVTFLINGYDSGLSTGRVRWAYEGMLGPSDYRKCMSTALGHGSAAQKETGRLLEDRGVVLGLHSLHRDGDGSTMLRGFAQGHPDLTVEYAAPMLSWLRTFFDSEPVSAGELSLVDMALGNALFAGAFIQCRNSFNGALAVMQEALLAGSNVSICNVTCGEDLWLTAQTATHLTVDEGTIVADHPLRPITKLSLLPRSTTAALWERYREWNLLDKETSELVASSDITPELSPEAEDAIATADLIVFGSGTQHSSLLPSYLTQGLSSMIAENRHAIKLLFVNGDRDLDFHHSEGPQDLLDKAQDLLAKQSGLPFDSLVTEVYAASVDWDHKGPAATGDVALYAGGARVTNMGRSVLTATDAYSGFAATLGQTLGQAIAPSSTVVSLIVPVLNEVATLPEFLREIVNLHQMHGLNVERVFVDGGSTDGSWELIQEAPGVTGFQADGRLGRARCIREGLLRSRGEYACVLHADGEYELADTVSMLGALIAYPDALVFGSRTHGAGSETNLRRTYGGSGPLYWVARFGGVAVSALLSVRLGRVISDPFCGLFAAKRKVLADCFDGRGGIDANVRMLLRSRRFGYQIVETGVNYAPRSREAGKKTTVVDGLRAIVSGSLPVNVHRAQRH